MSFDFDPQSIGLEPPAPATPKQRVQQQVDAVDEYLAEEEELDTQLSEVEKRLEKAQYYRTLLNHDVFDGDDSEAARAIVDELRVFIRARLGVLVGVTQEPAQQVAAKLPFEQDEVQILQQLARKLLKKPQLMETAPAEPTWKKAPPPATPTLKKVQTKSPPTSVPGPKRSDAVKAKEKPKATKETLTVDGIVYQKHIDAKQGTIYIDETGRRYKIATTPDGKKLMQSITTQAKPSGGVKPLPALTSAQITMVSQRQAAEVASKMDKGLGALVQTAIQTPPKE